MSEGTEIYDATFLAFPDEDPKRMETTITESLFPPFVGLTAHTIYEFDGETLIFASNEPGVAETPTQFVPGGGTRVWELTKQSARRSTTRPPEWGGVNRWHRPGTLRLLRWLESGNRTGGPPGERGR